MINRTAISARRWGLCAVTGLFLFHPAAVRAQSEGENPQEELKSAVQKKLDALYSKDGKQAPNMMPAGRTTPQPEPSIRQTAEQTAPRQQAAAPARRTATASTGPKSDVQKQLEELYAREGREMPKMSLPEAAESVQQEQAAEESEPAEVVAEEPKKPSLMQRMNPFKSRKPAPKQPANPRARRPVQPQQETEVDAAQADAPKKSSRFVPGFMKRKEAEAPKEMPQPRTAESIAARPRRTAQAPAHAEQKHQAPATRGIRISEPAEAEVADSDAEESLEEAQEAAEESAPVLEERPAKVAAQPGRAKATANPRNVTVRKAPKLEDEPELVRKPDIEKSLDLEDDKVEIGRAELTPKKTAKELLDVEFDKAPGKKTVVAKEEPKADEPKEEVSSAPYVEDFSDPFTEMGEQAADNKGADPKVAPVKHIDKKPEVAEKKVESPEDNPFTGLTLDDAGEVRGSKQTKSASAPKLTAAPKAVEAPKLTAAPKLEESPKLDDAPKQVQAPKLEPELKPAPELKKEPETTPAPVAAAPQLSALAPALEKVPDVAAPRPLPAAKAAAMPNNIEDPLERAKLRRLGSRRGQLGLKGFCPVALREQRDLVDSRSEFSTVYEGKTYQFSSAEAKATFESEPEKFVPAKGGVDVIVEANSHQSVEGSLDHAVWFRDKLYLFSTAESLEAFVQNPTDYVR